MADAAERANSVFVTGLKNAHALENQALELMNRQVERIENYPEIKAKLEQHIQETHKQIERLETILGQLGESRSVLKDNLLSLTGNMAAVAHAATQDEIIKNSIANFAFENFEIASYKSLIQLAGETGHRDAAQPLHDTLREEEEMAQWLDGHLAGVTHTYLERYVAEEKAGL
ncbi:MAG: ferritin-like domain-containing protein [Rhodomicrobium sp.]|jgi:ferritin-like metal-binding protein YciE